MKIVRFFPPVVFLLWLLPVGGGAQDTLVGLNEEEFVSSTFIAKTGGDAWQYFDLGCVAAGPWSGYFAPHRWTERPANYRITDAGNVLLPASRAARYWTIVIPADGYLSFHLSTSDGLTPPISTIYRNGVATASPLRLPDGTIYSSYFYCGDELRLKIPAAPADLLLSRLQFYTNARGVFISPGGATEAADFRTVERDQLARVSFPVPGDVGLEIDAEPWPVFDFDGDPYTLDDRHVLDRSDDRFTLTYTDRAAVVDAQYWLLRDFTIAENCREGDTLIQTARWAPLPLIAEQ